MYRYPHISGNDHLIHIYQSKGNKIEVSVRYIAESIRALIPVYMFLDSKTVDRIKNLLSSIDINPRNLLHSYFAEDFFFTKNSSKSSFLDTVSEIVHASDASESGIRFLADMNYFMTSTDGYTDILDVEKKLHEMILHRNVTILCEYFFENIPVSLYKPLSDLHNKVIIDPLIKSNTYESTDISAAASIENTLDKFILSRSTNFPLKRSPRNNSSSLLFPQFHEIVNVFYIITDIDFTIYAFHVPDSLEKRIDQKKFDNRILFSIFYSIDPRFTPENLRKIGTSFQCIASLKYTDAIQMKGLLTFQPINSSGLHLGYFIQFIEIHNFDILSYSYPRNLQSINLDEQEKFIIENNGSKQYINEKEYQIIQAVVNGMQNKEIATDLNLAEITIKKYLSRIYRKLDIKNRYDLIQLIQRNQQ